MGVTNKPAISINRYFMANDYLNDNKTGNYIKKLCNTVIDTTDFPFTKFINVNIFNLKGYEKIDVESFVETTKYLLEIFNKICNIEDYKFRFRIYNPSIVKFDTDTNINYIVLQYPYVNGGEIYKAVDNKLGDIFNQTSYYQQKIIQRVLNTARNSTYGAISHPLNSNIQFPKVNTNASASILAKYANKTVNSKFYDKIQITDKKLLEEMQNYVWVKNI